MAGVTWGRFDEALTPAFWAARAAIETQPERQGRFRLGYDLREEVAACLLGGHGIPAEVGLAAFERLRHEGVLKAGTDRRVLYALLSRPLSVGNRTVHYRFARQKSTYLADSLRILEAIRPLPTDARGFRDALLALPGVGRKTASWITRNTSGTDDVAILDIHICRACEAARVFPAGSNPAREYPALESRFVEFARAISVRASVLDSLMWRTMRRFSKIFPSLVRQGATRPVRAGVFSRHVGLGRRWLRRTYS
jgi:thermostable 8-oxoguanine DNA glycosylase